jgi:hypothetical protein
MNKIKHCQSFNFHLDRIILTPTLHEDLHTFLRVFRTQIADYISYIYSSGNFFEPMLYTKYETYICVQCNFSIKFSVSKKITHKWGKGPEMLCHVLAYISKPVYSEQRGRVLKCRIYLPFLWFQPWCICCLKCENLLKRTYQYVCLTSSDLQCL